MSIKKFFHLSSLLFAFVSRMLVHASADYSESSELPVLQHPKYHIESKMVTGNSTFPCPPPVIDPESHPWPNTQLETSISVGLNPICRKYPMVAIVHQEDRYNSAGGSSAIYMILSLDGGKTFEPPIPFPTVLCFNGPYERDTNPHVAISSQGDIYVTSVPYNVFVNGLNNTAIGKYDVREKRFTYIEYLDLADNNNPPFTATDFPGLAIDPQDKSGKTVYVTWDWPTFPSGDFPMVSFIRMSKTLNGQGFSPPKDVYVFPPASIEKFGDDAGAQFLGLHLLNNPGKTFSKLLAIFTLTVNFERAPPPNILQEHLYSSVSLDQGNTWTNPIPLDNTLGAIEGQIVDPDNTETLVRSGGSGIAVDRDRNIIYSVSQQHSLVYDGIPTQIVLYLSTDDAASWKRIGPVNTVLSTQANTPAICLMDEGKIAISYYDFRNHTTPNPIGPLETDRWMDIYYYDKEKETLTLETELRLTESSFDERNAPQLSGGFLAPPGLFLGDYAEQVYFERRIYHAFAIVPPNSGPNSSHIQFSIITQERPIPGNQ